MSSTGDREYGYDKITFKIFPLTFDDYNRDDRKIFVEICNIGGYDMSVCL